MWSTTCQHLLHVSPLAGDSLIIPDSYYVPPSISDTTSNFETMKTWAKFKSSDPINFQNIPSHNREIRMLFKSKQSEQSVELNENQLNVKRFDYVNTPTGWQFASKLKQGDLIVLDCEDGTVENATIRTIELNNNSEYIITI